MDKPRVILGVPHLGNLPGYFFDSLMALAATGPGVQSIIRIENKPVDEARNLITKGFLNNPDATHLFFMDADQTFPHNALERLLSREKDVIGGVYFARTDTPVPHFYDFAREDAKGQTWYRAKALEYRRWLDEHPEHWNFGPEHVFQDSPSSLQRCDAIATGCLLISRRVIEAFPYPWFESWKGMPGGEDFDFCRKAREHGFEIWADLSVQCGHEIRMAMGSRREFIECYGIGTPDEHDFNDPVLIEAGPNGRRVMLGRQDGFEFPEEVEGYLLASEGRKLFELAKTVPEDGLIVELGSYKGKATICLAQAGRKVMTVDDFRGEAESELDDPRHAHEDHMSGKYRAELEENLVKAGVGDHVIIYESDTRKGPPTRTEYMTSGGNTAPVRLTYSDPVDMLFVDAAHDYESVSADIEAWEPHILPDGILAFHDSNFPGVERVIVECGQRGWRHIDHAGTLVALRRAYQEVK